MITTYSYDAAGNRTRQNVDGALTTYAYDAANRLRRSQEVSGITTYTFDANGNQRSIRTPAGAITSYSWTFENQMSRIEEPDGDLTTYTWAPVNRNSVELRIAKETEAALTKFLWDDQSILRETDAVGTVEAEYTLQPKAFGELVSQRRGADSSFYAFDALGSAAALTDGTAAVTDEYAFKPFGETRSSSGTTENPYRWVGKVGYYHDDESGLYSVRRRSYDDASGRWVSQDPLGLSASDSNFYRYAGNNATNGQDPSGTDLHIRNVPGHYPQTNLCFWTLAWAIQLSARQHDIEINVECTGPGGTTATIPLGTLLLGVFDPDFAYSDCKLTLATADDYERLRRLACTTENEFHAALIAALISPDVEGDIWCERFENLKPRYEHEGRFITAPDLNTIRERLGCDGSSHSVPDPPELVAPVEPDDTPPIAGSCPPPGSVQPTPPSLSGAGVDCDQAILVAILGLRTGQVVDSSRTICACLVKPRVADAFGEGEYGAEVEALLALLCEGGDWSSAIDPFLEKLKNLAQTEDQRKCLQVLIDLAMGGGDLSGLEKPQLIDLLKGLGFDESTIQDILDLIETGGEWTGRAKLLRDMLDAIRRLKGAVEAKDAIAGVAAVLAILENVLKFGNECGCLKLEFLEIDKDGVQDLINGIECARDLADVADLADELDLGDPEDLSGLLAQFLDVLKRCGLAEQVDNVDDWLLAVVPVLAVPAYLICNRDDVPEACRQNQFFRHCRPPGWGFGNLFKSWADWIEEGCNDADFNGGGQDITGMTRAQVEKYYEDNGGCWQVHGHHIVEKGRSKDKMEAQKILCEAGIDPYLSCHNLCFSCNRCHTKDYDKKVCEELEATDGSAEEIKEALVRLCWIHRQCANRQLGPAIPNSDDWN